MNLSDVNIPPVLFVTGTGTDVGKSFATGWIAREIMESGRSCITQKMIQTGNVGNSEDIDRHRKIMGTGYLPVDDCHLTAPVIFSYPASPHLAAKIDGKEIDLNVIDSATESLARQFSHVLVEGAGGLMVPITEDYLTADYISERNLPTVAVVSGELGSINHALLTLKAIENYGIELFAVIYNPYFDKDPVICDDSRRYIQEWLNRHFPESLWLEMPNL